MTVSPIPEGYHTVTPYLVLEGLTELIPFLEKAFDAKLHRRLQTPDGRIMHADVVIGDSHIMMGEPRGPEDSPRPGFLHLYVEDCDAAFAKAVAAGATIVMEPAPQFYGDRSAGVADAFGNLWWLASRQEELSDAEILKRMPA